MLFQHECGLLVLGFLPSSEYLDLTLIHLFGQTDYRSSWGGSASSDRTSSPPTTNVKQATRVWTGTAVPQGNATRCYFASPKGDLNEVYLSSCVRRTWSATYDGPLYS